MRYVLISVLAGLLSAPISAQTTEPTIHEYDTVVAVDANCRVDKDVLAKRISVGDCVKQKLNKDGVAGIIIVDTQTQAINSGSAPTETVTIHRADLDRLCANWRETRKGRMMKTVMLAAVRNSAIMAFSNSYGMYANMGNAGSAIDGVMHVNNTCRK